MVDVLQLLSRYRVEYVETGPNVAKGNVNVQCPWCGVEDHSHHLGINLEKGYWGCWRNKAHRGRKLYKLVAKLAGLSFSEARRATGEAGHRAIQQGDMERAVLALGGAEEVGETLGGSPTLAMPEQFRRLCPNRARRYNVEGSFIGYLHSRKFRSKDIPRVCRRYRLHYCVSGDFSDRIIIPVYENKKLMTYLGRSVYNDATLRYRALDKETSVKQVKDCVYGYDRALEGGRTLVIVEGALDAMKVDFYNFRKEMRAIGLFNMNLEPAQLELLIDLIGLYDRYIILLDQGELAASLRLESELGFLKGIKVRFLQGVEDPGALKPKHAEELHSWL